ncbi:uracil-DNA glycosylase family protein [Aureisphaera sp. CAU 1614]|uniref:Uracil-DNA glycosylase family protein n=1 Tax=Halomarinibacterium sedimenti TaxID=2857106 RepID=A0A9X1JUW7_9FLAO|nr:uracil-DNA glycosylase family protein [Halomarinibacterium sedimenti]MBW2937324.1 uracil-DNA glycosylase family protein [Halomarinibacterium sedimenti]
MKSIIAEVKECTMCKTHLPLGPRPVFSIAKDSKIAIIGQAPGTKVHESGIPWDDASGKLLRTWLEVTEEEFYNPSNFAIVPMGFCYPGKGKSGDLPPRPECAPLWHEQLFELAKSIELYILIGTYAQSYYLKENSKKNLTETVRNFKEYQPNYFPLPHPSPRNRFWFRNNEWFEKEVLPELKIQVQYILSL